MVRTIKKPHSFEQASERFYFGCFVLFAVCVITGAFLYFNFEKKNIKNDKYKELSEIANLKIDQIIRWKKERLGDGQVIMDNVPMKNEISRYLKTGHDDNLNLEISNVLKSLILNYDYQSAVITNTSLTPVISYPAGQSVSKSYLQSYLNTAFKKGRIIFTDLHKSKNSPGIHLDMLLPLRNEGVSDTILLGVLILRIDPEKILFPLIQRWPTSSRTSESLLVEAQADSVVFMNNLRHSSANAMKFKLPLTAELLPAAEAVKGNEGPVEGIDYRGVPVVAYSVKVPDTPWYMVAKVDKSELFSSLRYHAGMVIIITILLIITAGTLAGFFQRSRSVSLIKAKMQVQQEKLEVEEKFRYISARYEAILDSVPNIIMEVDSNKIYTWANQAGIDFFGDDVIGKEASYYFEGNKDVYRIVKPLFNGTNDKVYVESFQRRKDGEKRLLSWWCKALHDETGKTTGTLSSATDITEQYTANLSIQESERKFRALFELSPLGKSMTGIKGSLYVNNAFCRLTGYTESELLKKTWKEITHPEDIQHTQNIIDSLTAGVITEARFEKRYIHKNGNVIYSDVSTYIHRDANNDPEFFITTINDITERKKAEMAVRENEKKIQRLNEELEERVIQRTAQLEAANKELEAFSYSVSHDLRSPLRAIHSFTSILLEEYAKKMDDEGKRICGIIESSTVHMGNLIDDLLSFSRVGRSDLINSKIDMKSLVKSCFNEMTENEERKRVEFNVMELPDAIGDQSMLKLVWTNLISNALKYSSGRDKAIIHIGYEVNDSENIYYIKDNGVGFDRQYYSKLFGVFQRLHSQKDFEGNGVGLAIVQRIIKRHNGNIWAEGEPDKGATFYFSFPA